MVFLASGERRQVCSYHHNSKLANERGASCAYRNPASGTARVTKFRRRSSTNFWRDPHTGFEHARLERAADETSREFRSCSSNS
jgi:hypothetical protein